MIRRKGAASRALIASLATLIFIGCGTAACTKTKDNSNNNSGNTNPPVTQSQSFSIKDSSGQIVEFSQVPDKIAVLDATTYNLINLLGGSKKIVGVSSMLAKTKGIVTTNDIGTWQNPNINQIKASGAQVVFANYKYPNTAAQKQLEADGIKVVFIDANNISTLENDVTATGKILGETQKAQDFNTMASKYINLVIERTSNISPADKVTVYLEQFKPDVTSGKNSPEGALLSAAGVVNIAQNDASDTTVTNPWILAQNPQMIIKLVEPGTGVLGEGVSDLTKASNEYDALVQREGWSKLKAVQNGKVYLMDSKFVLSDTMIIPGMLYIAQAAYPEQIKYDNPQAVQDQIEADFLGGTKAGYYIYKGK